jgi:hypothetical protein
VYGQFAVAGVRIKGLDDSKARQSGDAVRLVCGLDKKKAYGCGTSTGTSGGSGSLVASSSAGRRGGLHARYICDSITN